MTRIDVRRPTIIPGHGDVMRDWSCVDQVSGLLGTTLARVRQAATEGVSLDDLREQFVRGDRSWGLAFDAFCRPPAVERAYMEVRGTVPPAGGR